MRVLRRRTPGAFPVRLDEGGHTGWCAQDHRCGLGEHRAEAVVVQVDGVGSMLVTRVMDRHGREHAEVRGSVVLDDREPVARRQLLRLLSGLGRLLAVTGLH